jgi:hypothetical protein
MNEELLKLIEREVLGWPESSRRGTKMARAASPSTGSAVSRSLTSRTTASYRIRSAEDLPGAPELLHMSYERTAARDERQGTTV